MRSEWQSYAAGCSRERRMCRALHGNSRACASPRARARSSSRRETHSTYRRAGRTRWRPKATWGRARRSTTSMMCPTGSSVVHLDLVGEASWDGKSLVARIDYSRTEY
eukprot:6297375-Prymnesium_polylepis.1